MNTSTNQTFIEDLRLVEVAAWWQSPWAWLIIAAISVTIFLLVRRWRRAQSIALKLPKPAPTGPPPHVEALRRIEELRARHTTLTAYQVAIECSDILRRYIEARFQSSIRYQTTREFLGAAQANPDLAAESREELRTFLEFFDGLKFAQDSADAARTASAIDGAERFIRKCIPAVAA